MKWRFLYTPGLSGQMNMALDQYFLNRVENGEALAVLRLYSWNPYTFSLGNAQKAERELDLNKVKEAEFGVVRRMTGGRVVFHSEELTYSVIAPLHVMEWTRTLSSTYERINLALQDALSSLGFPVELERGEFIVPFEKNSVQKPCFASTSKSELVHNGKKVVGSAQRRLRNSFIQHGSILVGKKHLQVSDFLLVKDPVVYQKSLAKNAISLSEIGEFVSEIKMVETIESSFSKTLSTNLCTEEITTLEFKDASDLCDRFLIL